MKKSVVIPLIFLILIAGALIAFFTPKAFGKHLRPDEVDHIIVFDGNTGFGFTIDDREQIAYIVENLQSHPVRRVGISLGTTGYGFKITYVDSTDHAVIPVFLLNSPFSIRKDPFFYHCDGGLCFDYLKGIEDSFTN